MARRRLSACLCCRVRAAAGGARGRCRNNMEAVPKLQRRRSACALLFSGDSTAGLEIDVKPYRLAQRCSSVFAADR